jgi:TPR repeat protein
MNMPNGIEDLPAPPGWPPPAYPPDTKRPLPPFVIAWLGFLYLGNGLEKDHQKALACFRRAAEAQSVLGALYANGIGTNRDYTSAAFWWEYPQ